MAKIKSCGVRMETGNRGELCLERGKLWDRVEERPRGLTLAAPGG